MEKCQQVSFQVLSCFAIGLGFEEDFFTKVGLAYSIVAGLTTDYDQYWPFPWSSSGNVHDGIIDCNEQT